MCLLQIVTYVVMKKKSRGTKEDKGSTMMQACHAL